MILRGIARVAAAQCSVFYFQLITQPSTHRWRYKVKQKDGRAPCVFYQLIMGWLYERRSFLGLSHGGSAFDVLRLLSRIVNTAAGPSRRIRPGETLTKTSARLIAR